MYYPLYSNPFYYPAGAYMNNMCSYGHVQNTNTTIPPTISSENSTTSQTRNTATPLNNIINNDLFSVVDDRLEVLGISIKIDDLIILIILFFMFRENQIDYGVIIILALILFDQN